MSGSMTLTPTVNEGGTYTLTVTNANNGCSASDNTTVTENNALPNAVAGNDATVCAGGSTQLNAGGSTGQGTLLYSWTPTMGLSNPNIPNPVATPTSTTTYTVKVTSGNGCTDTDNIIVNVDQQPSQANVDPPTIKQCNDASFTISATIPAVGTGTWSVVPGPGSGSVVVQMPMSATTAVTGVAAGTSVTLRWTITSGVCPSTTDDVVLTNHILPTANIQVSNDATGVANNDGIVCLNDPSITLSAGTSTGQAPLSYAWSQGGNSATIQIPTNLVLLNTPVTVIVTDGNGCTKTQVKNVTVHPLPIASITIDESSGNMNDDFEICKGDTATLTANGAGTQGSYEWENGDASAIRDITPNAMQIYSVIVTDVNKCKDDQSKEVMVNVPPTAVILPDPFNGFEFSSTLTLSFLPTPTQAGSSNIISYDWSFSNADPSDTTTFTPTKVKTRPLSPGFLDANLKVTDSKGCTDWAVTATTEIILDASCTIDVQPLEPVCTGDPVQILATTTSIVESDTSLGSRVYYWKFSDGTKDTIFGAISNTKLTTTNHTFYNSGSTPITDTVSVYFTQILGIGDTCMSNTEVVYITVNPSPSVSISMDSTVCFGDSIEINFTGMQAGLFDIRLTYDNSGDFTTFPGIENNQKEAVSSNLFAPGSYIIFTVVQIVNHPETGCINLAPNASDTILITPSPTINSFRYTKPCVGGDLSVSFSTTSDLVSYAWQNASGSTVSTNDTLFIGDVMSTDSGSYTLLVTDINGCSIERETMIEIKEPPQPNIVGLAEPCYNLYNVLYSIDAKPEDSIVWSVTRGSLIEGQYTDSIFVHWKDDIAGPGDGQVSVMVDNTPGDIDGCEGVDVKSITITNDVEVLDTTEIILFYTDDNGDSLNFFLVSVDTAQCYRWGNGIDTLPNGWARSYFLGEDLPSDNPTLDGYYVEIWNGDCTNPPSCVQRSNYRNQTVAQPTPPTEASIVVTLYPNPASSEFFVRMTGASEEDAFDLSIHDLNGRELTSVDAVPTNGKVVQIFDVERFPNGFYLLSVQDKTTGKKWHLPLVVHH